MKGEVLIKQYIGNILSEKVAQVSHNANELMSLLAESIVNNSVNEISVYFKEERTKFEALMNYLKINADIEKQKVYYFSAIKTMIELIDLVDKQSSEKQEYKEYMKYKYIYPTLEILSKNNTLSQGKISQELGISKNTLSNFFRKTKEFKLWSVEVVGQKHYYTISAKGKKAYKNYRMNCISKNQENQKEFLLFFTDALIKELNSTQPNVDKVIKEISSKYSEGISILSSANMKIKLRYLFMKYENNFQRRNEKYDIAELERDRKVYSEYREYREYGEYRMLQDYDVNIEEIYDIQQRY